jgi:hypothetical protein
MKPRIITAALMFISSYFPLVPIFIVKDLNASTARPDHPRLAVILIAVMSFACIVVIIAARSFKSGVETKVTKVSNKSADMFTYTIPYMISFYNFNLGDWKTLTCLSIFMCTMFLLSYKTNNFLVNPVLALEGYGLYDCQLKSKRGPEWQGLVLSRESVRVGDSPKLEQISPFLYLVTSPIEKEDNDAHSG